MMSELPSARTTVDWSSSDETGSRKGDVSVHVYTIPLLRHRPRLTSAVSELSEAERARAKRFHRPRDRERFILAHAEMRRHLAVLAGTDAATLDFAAEANGKPVICGPEPARRWAFNLSHSGNFALLAAALETPLGVDIERKRSIADSTLIAERFFSAAERRRMAEAEETRDDVFYSIWTRKEAVIKALGYGLAMPLAAFDVCEPGHWHATPIFRLDEVDGVSIPRKGWRVMSLEVPWGYAGAIAILSSRAIELLHHRSDGTGIARSSYPAKE
jgi:4'-phosphopantetheinyl transferase